MYFATNLSKIFDIARKNRRILFPCPLHHIPQIFPRVFEGFGKFEEALVGRASLGGLVEHVIANTGIIRRGDRCRVVVLSLQEEVDSTAVVLPSIVTFSQTTVTSEKNSFAGIEDRHGATEACHGLRIFFQRINHTSQQYVEKENTTGNDPVDERTRLREDDVNLYVGGSKSFGSALSLEASVAAEYYHSPVWKKWTVYPTFNLTWMPVAGQMLQLGLSYDRSYPSYWEMTNFTTYSNGGYDEITGNPNIKPSDSYNAHLVYLVRGKYQAVLFYNYTNNYFVQSPYLRSDRLAITYQYQNFDFHRQVGIQLTAPFQIGSWWNLRPTAIGMYLQEKDDSYFTLAINRHRFVFVGLLDNTFTLSKQPDITFNILGKVQTRAIQAIYDLSGCQRLDMSLRWQFARNHAVLRLYCNDLFESSSITPTINYANQHLAMHFSTYRELGINFTYKFGNYKERRHESVDTSRF